MLNVVAVAYQQGNLKARFAKDKQECPRSVPLRMFGDDAWVRRTARRLGLESTLRDPWRPKKPSPAAKETDLRGKEECPPSVFPR